ncbi:MAG: amidohydrolase [Ignavibacteriales bacterium]|nr:amidohydrolase [Ignavibacteriales bacterium]
MKTLVYITLAVVLSAWTFISIVSQKQSVDLLLINATVYTVDEENPVAEAIAVRGSRIVAVGSTQDIQNQYTSQNIIDARGKTIIPGLIDAHAHVLGLGEALTELNLIGTQSTQHIAKIVAEKVKQVKPGDWIRGYGWDQNDWGSGTGEKLFPTASILDKVAPNNPVILSRIDGHAIWVNSKAMELAYSRSDMNVDVDGGKIIRDRYGRPSGIFVDNAETIITSVVPEYTREEKLTMYMRAFDECLKYGITGVHDMGIDKTDFEIYKELADNQTLPVRIYGLIGGSGTLWDEMRRSGPYIDALHYQFIVRGIKLYVDGALGSRGAALIEPYSDEPENRGLITTVPDSLRIITEQALEAGFQVAIHAIGDRANRVVLDEYEKASLKYPTEARSARLRIEHAQVISPEDIPRFKKLNVIPSMQPTHATSDMYWAQARLGPERILGAYAWRSFLNDGNIVVSGSDFPVEHANPLLGFYAAVTRQDKDGIPKDANDVQLKFQLSADGIGNPNHFENGWYAEQKLTREEALRSFTIWAAFAEFTANQKGSIEEGKLADLVILSNDIMKCDPKEILTTAVEITIVGGKIRYQHSSGSLSERR